jgi:vanillate O-demethylase monooxygenase subunit
MNSWYAVATSREVGRQLLGRRALDVPVLLYRTLAGEVVTLEDRCLHRPYPLSLGRLEGDNVVSGYSGFEYDPRGHLVRVPTQLQVPFGARVRRFPAHDDGEFVWIWFGEPALAALRPPPALPWLTDPSWATVGQEWTTEAGHLLLHENFADITHVAVVDEYISPPVLRSVPPPLEVEVAQTSVTFVRKYPPAPLAGWHAEAAGLPADAVHEQREEGRFVSPGLWVNRWDVVVGAGSGERGDGDGGAAHSFRFTHAITPVSAGRTLHAWRVSRNFALEPEVSDRLVGIFAAYYQRVREILQTMQGVLEVDGPRPGVNVSSDVVALQVRKIIAGMVADESGRPRAGHRAVGH